MSDKPKSANVSGYMPPAVKGIAERPRPANTGWCGAEDCKHLSHKHFSSPAKPVK
jgi:hypothetical protein